MTETAQLVLRAPPSLLQAAKHNTYHNGRQTDAKFVEDMKALGRLCRNRRNLIGTTQKLTDLQCQEISMSAELHRDAARPNSYYQMQFRAIQLEEATSKPASVREEIKHNYEQCERLRKTNICICDCKQVKGDPLPACTSIDDLQFLGSTTMLFFFYTKVVACIALILVLTSGGYSMVDNFINRRQFSPSCAQNTYCAITNAFTVQNRSTRPDLVAMDLRLIFISTLATIIVLRIAKYKATILDLMIDRSMETPSDFAIKMENMPEGSYNQDQVLQFLHRLELGLPNDAKKETEPVQYKAIHIVYNMKGARQLISSIEDQCIKLGQMIDREGKLRMMFQDQDYISGKLRLMESLESLEDLRKKFLNEIEYRKALATTCCIVEFGTEDSQKRFIKEYGNKKFGVLDEIGAWWSRVVKKSPGRSQQLKGRLIQIERAPQPEDLLWQNCEKSYSLARLVVIWSVTFGIILLSFGLIVALQYAQMLYSVDTTVVRSQMLDILNTAVSVVLIIVNKGLWVALLMLIKIEYNHTCSERIISTINKAIIAQAANSIALPIIINLVMEKNMFGQDGLVGQVLNYSISNSLVPIALLLLDPGYWIKKLFLWLRCSRYRIILFLSKGEPIEPGQTHVREVNKFYEGGDIDVTGSYVYLTGGLLYCAFNAVLQPLILVILLVCTLLFYYIKKYLLLSRYNVPVMLSKLVFDNVLMALNYVPIFQVIGGAVYTGFIFGIQRMLLDPCAISLFIALIHLRNPCGIFDKAAEWVCKKCSKKTVVQEVEKKKRKSVMLQVQRRSTIGKTAVIEHARQMAEAFKAAQQGRGLLQQYHHYNHLDTLLGYQRLIRGELPQQNDAIKQQLKKFAMDAIDQCDNRFEYPKQCESMTSEPLAKKPTMERPDCQ